MRWQKSFIGGAVCCLQYVVRVIVFARNRVSRYLAAMMTARISSDGQIVIPAEWLELDRIQPGQTFRIERVGSGDYRLIRESNTRNAGLVDSLLACPEKDYFKPIQSESTDTL